MFTFNLLTVLQLILHSLYTVLEHHQPFPADYHIGCGSVILFSTLFFTVEGQIYRYTIPDFFPFPKRQRLFTGFIQRI